jgi:hypothetical protein
MLLPFLRDLQIKTFMTNEQNYAKCKTAIFLMSAIKLQHFVQLLFQDKILNFFSRMKPKTAKKIFLVWNARAIN